MSRDPRPRRVGRDGVGGGRRPRRADRPRGHGRRHPAGGRCRAAAADSAHRNASSRVDVDDPASLAAALAGTEVVLNATYMRHNVPVTDAAIAAGVHLVDLGSYYPETLEQLDAARRGRGGRLPDRARLRRRARPDQHPRPARRGRSSTRVDAVRLYSYITHPMWTSPGIVVTRFDASTGTSRRPRGRPARGAAVVQRRRDDRLPGTLWRADRPPRPPSGSRSRSRAPSTSANVVFKVGYPADETRRIEALLELGFDRDDAVRARWRRDLAAPLCRRVHRAAAGSAPTTAAPTSSRSAWMASATDGP